MQSQRFMLCFLIAAGFLAGTAGAQDGRSQKLLDGFDAPAFSAEGGLYYRENGEQAAGSYEFQSAVKRSGPGGLKLSVRPLCDPQDDECSERAEVWEKTPLRVPYNEPVWYGFAMKLSDPIPQDDHRYLMAQWKREIGPDAEGDFSPFLALRLDRGKMFFTVETNFISGGARPEGDKAGTCPTGMTPVWFRPETRQMRALVAAGTDWNEDDAAIFPDCTDKLSVTAHNPLPRVSNGWVDFAIYSHPDPNGKGRIEIFADKVWIATVTGHIGHGDYGLGKNQYFKFGPYRASAADTWTVFYDDFRRSPDCIDVLGDEKACEAVR